MRSFLAVCLAIALTSLLILSAQADEKIPDSTGWHRVHKGRVNFQAVQSSKLPTDTLIVVWRDEKRPVKLFLANQNAMVMIEQMFFSAKVSALIPAEICWQTDRRGRRVEWKRHGHHRVVFRLPIKQVAAVYYGTAQGRQALSLVGAEAAKPMYQPKLIQLKPPKVKKHKHSSDQ